jgi:hypothetical protein
MQNLLIIFVVLLVLLTLISTLGGSIYPKESFEEVKEEEVVVTEETPQVPEHFWEEEKPAAEQPTPEPTEVAPKEDVVEAFDGDMYAPAN